MVGQRFQNNRKDGKHYGDIAVVTEYKEKFKTVTLQYEGTNEFTSVSTATLKSKWKKVQADENETVQPVVEPENSAENVSTDSTDTTEATKEVGKKSTKQATKKKEKASMDSAYTLIAETVKQAGYECVADEKNPRNMWVFVNGKKRCGIYVGSRKCALGLSKTLAPDNIKADRVRNCPNSHAYDVSYDAMDKLVTVLSSVNFDKEEK